MSNSARLLENKEIYDVPLWSQPMASISFLQCIYRVLLAYVFPLIFMLVRHVSFRFTRTLVFSIFPAPKKSINNEIVLITGSAGVLGRALATEFSKNGAILCLWDIDEVENEKTYRLLSETYDPRKMVAMKVDIRSDTPAHAPCLFTCCLFERRVPEEIRRAADVIQQKIGHVSIIVQNAGRFFRSID